MSITDDITASLATISLEETDAVKLMNRVDTKMVFSIRRLPEVIALMKPHYRILSIDGIRAQHYDSLYFDTVRDRCYLDHHNGRAKRFKVRSRCYCDTGQRYLEVKMKNNKGRTRKERKLQPGGPGEFLPKHERLLSDCAGITPGDLVPALQVDFTRMTFVNNHLTERITIDTGISFRRGDAVRSLHGLAVAEVKQDRLSRSYFRGILEGMHIHPFRVSKYCLGRAMLDETVKRNNFMEKIHIINKTNHDIS